MKRNIKLEIRGEKESASVFSSALKSFLASDELLDRLRGP